ncbi:MAG: hypothetical protein JWR37_5746 [Mycobacterium sp.]|jgi:uncharacterized protein YndB with AHSA1/START domain|nr:hypothetical protein [Mycobacterium sp.]
MSTDRIEKQVLLRAPLDRVWRAISDSDEFGRWFGAEFDGPFIAGATVTGVITPTKIDEDVARQQEPYTGQVDTWEIVAVEPEKRLAFRWHPVPAGSNGAPQEPATLVEFTLTEESDGTLLRIVESGFDAISPERRRTAFEGNSQGWAIQVDLVRKYLALGEKV